MGDPANVTAMCTKRQESQFGEIRTGRNLQTFWCVIVDPLFGPTVLVSSLDSACVPAAIKQNPVAIEH